jgi:hypothetical protein
MARRAVAAKSFFKPLIYIGFVAIAMSPAKN